MAMIDGLRAGALSAVVAEIDAEGGRHICFRRCGSSCVEAEAASESRRVDVGDK